VAAAAWVISAASDYYNRFEIAAQKAAASAERLAEEYNKVKEAE
jgi:hypothetical protein